MPKSELTPENIKQERRKHWRDRRSALERRSCARLSNMDGECRNNVPRRESDVAGKLDEGELWWSGDRKFV